MSDWTMEMDASADDLKQIYAAEPHMIGDDNDIAAVDAAKSALQLLVTSGAFGPGPFHLSVAATSGAVHLSINANMGLPSQQPPIELED